MKEYIQPLLSRKPLMALSFFLLIMGCYDVPFQLIPQSDSSVPEQLIGEWYRPKTSSTREGRISIEEQAPNVLKVRFWDQEHGERNATVTVSRIGNFLVASAKHPGADENYTVATLKMPILNVLEISLLKTTLPQFESAQKLRSFLENVRPEEESAILDPPMIFHRITVQSDGNASN